MRAAVVGTGYVGLVTGVCLSHLGHEVVCVDRDEKKIENLKKGILPIYEPGLQEILEKCAEKERLFFSSSLQSAGGKDFLFIAVGTPSDEIGRADLSQVEAVVEALSRLELVEDLLVVMKSTVPVGTCIWAETFLKEKSRRPERFRVVSCPEFLREGTAVDDFIHPERIVIGAEQEGDARKVQELFAGIETRFVLTDTRSSELIKYASNAFLATKISFINEIAGICERAGADVKEVARGMGLDSRIGEKFLNAGLGYGGSCFPKDTLALIYQAEDLGYDFRILKAVAGVNEGLRKRAVQKLERLLGGNLQGKKIGLWGLSFKPGTDDIREAPSLTLIQKIKARGGEVTAYDPLVKGLSAAGIDGMRYADDPYGAAEGADAVVLVTEWEEFRKADLARVKKAMSGNVFLDGRNVFDPLEMKGLGFVYEGMGRGTGGEMS